MPHTMTLFILELLVRPESVFRTTLYLLKLRVSILWKLLSKSLMILTFPGRNRTGCFLKIGKSGNATNAQMRTSLMQHHQNLGTFQSLRGKPLSLLHYLKSVFMDLAFGLREMQSPNACVFRTHYAIWKLACFFFFIYVSFRLCQGIYFLGLRMVNMIGGSCRDQLNKGIIVQKVLNLLYDI